MYKPSQYTELYHSANFRDNSGYLVHYRLKGDKNGYSRIPGYNPIGEKAQGKTPDRSTLTDLKESTTATASRVAAIRKSRSEVSDTENARRVAYANSLSKQKDTDTSASTSKDISDEKKNTKDARTSAGTGGKRFIDDEETEESRTSEEQKLLSKQIYNNAKKISGTTTGVKVDTRDNDVDTADAAELAKRRAAAQKTYEKAAEEDDNKSVRERRKELVKAKNEAYDTNKKYGSDTGFDARSEKLAASLKTKAAQDAYDKAKEERKKKNKEAAERAIARLKNRFNTWR